MTNTVLFDTIRRAGPISTEQIAAIADAVETKMAPLASEVGDLQAKANAISATASELVQAVQGIAGQVESLPDDLRQLKNTTTQILHNVPPPHFSGRGFERIRKCLQLLSRLEDWDLADSFDGAKEFREKEFATLKKQCLTSCGNDPAIEDLLDKLKDKFPERKDPETRAAYYIDVLLARIAILRWTGSSAQGVKM